jgi:hypothetical protein
MLSPRLATCTECANINALISETDCKLVEMADILYNNTVFMLNKSFNSSVMFDLLMYKRILSYKICNPDYAGNYSVNLIASKIKILKFK